MPFRGSHLFIAMQGEPCRGFLYVGTHIRYRHFPRRYRAPRTHPQPWLADPATFTFSYSPVRGDQGQGCGICSSVVETTSRVMAENQQAFLVTLTNVLSSVTDSDEVMREAASLLGIRLSAHHVHYAAFDFERRLGTFYAGYRRTASAFLRIGKYGTTGLRRSGGHQ